MIKYGLAVIVPLFLVFNVDASPRRFVTGLSAEQKAMADQLPVHNQPLAAGSYTSLGIAEGISCMATYDDIYEASEGDAMQELKRAAVKKGANALMEPSCKSYGGDQGKNGCFRAVICRGTAIKASP